MALRDFTGGSVLPFLRDWFSSQLTGGLERNPLVHFAEHFILKM